MSLKTITAAVGPGCVNVPADVATVQYLLNCVPVSQGGPLRELAIDGFVGVVTTEAIDHFQQVRFGTPGNRIEPEQLSGGQTFSELKRYDPLPFSAPVIAPNLNQWSGGYKRALDAGTISGHDILKRTLDGGTISGHGILKRPLDGGTISGGDILKRPLDGGTISGGGILKRPFNT